MLRALATLLLAAFATIAGSQVAPSGSTLTPPGQMQLDDGARWSLSVGGWVVRCNPVCRSVYGWNGKQLLWLDGALYVQGATTSSWYALNRATGAATLLAGDPRDNVPPPPPPPPGEPGTWTQLPGAQTNVGAGTTLGWYNLAWDTQRARACGVSWEGQLWCWNAATAWVLVSQIPSSQGVHNRTLAYDPLNDLYWLSDGTGTPNGQTSFRPSTGAWTNHGETFGPSYEAAWYFDAPRKRLVSWGGWGLRNVSTFALDPIASAWVDTGIPRPIADTGDAAKMTAWRSVFDSARSRYLEVDVDGHLWAIPADLSSGWTKITTTGFRPPLTTQYVYDVQRDALVGWSGSPRVTGSHTETGQTRETWLLRLGTLAWVKGASIPDPVPPEATYVSYAMVYDPVGMRTILHMRSTTSVYSTWSYTMAPPVATLPGVPLTAGTITSFPLPTTATAPYSRSHGSKHTNMAHSPANDRLYVTGGDWIVSATDGTWSMDLSNGQWREDVTTTPPGAQPTVPYPSAAQDGMGFAWSASRGRLLLWPGSYVVNSWNRPEYAKGLWEFNPATNAWTQRLTMFAGGPETWTGNLFGGVFDEQTDTIYSFGDDSTVPEVKRWNVTTGVASTLPFPPGLQRPAGHAAYFRHGQHARIGRWIYVIGAYSDGIALTPMMFRYNIDTRAIEVLPQPPVNGSDMALIEIRVGVSGTKIVWPFTNGPEGVIRGIYVYDTVSRLWMVDNQRPSGFFGGNAVVSLPDGRVGFSGGAGGPIPTHIWFYKAAS